MSESELHSTYYFLNENGRDSRHLLSLPFRIVNCVGEFLLRAGVPFAQLEEEALLAEAIKQTGLSDFGEDNFREGLRVLLNSVKEVRFHLLGQISFQQFLIKMLINRLLIQDALKRLPLERTRLHPPFIVTGLPRSGTTFLHRLLAQDPANRVLPLWELLNPVPNGTKDRRRSQTERQTRMMAWLAPDLDKKHYTRADTPEECIILFASSFTSLIYGLMAPVYSYLDWFMEQDLRRVYQEYRNQLLILQQQAPPRRLALKAPAHLPALDIVQNVLPGAMIIQTHREPVECMRSINSLQYSLYALMAKDVEMERMARVNLNCLLKEMDRNISFHEAGPNTVFHLAYRDLIENPLACVRGVYEHFGVEFNPEFEHNLRCYMGANPMHKYGVHYYKEELFGLSEQSMRDRFSHYRRRFAQYL